MTYNYLNKYNGGMPNEITANSHGLPARLDANQTAQVLNCSEHDIPVLIGAGLLKPLGKPVQNARKYFATVEILSLTENANWLNKVTMAVSENWKKKNASRIKFAAVQEAALAA